MRLISSQTLDIGKNVINNTACNCFYWSIIIKFKKVSTKKFQNIHTLSINNLMEDRKAGLGGGKNIIKSMSQLNWILLSMHKHINKNSIKNHWHLVMIDMCLYRYSERS